jgi:hypothetical protein
MPDPLNCLFPLRKHATASQLAYQRPCPRHVSKSFEVCQSCAIGISRIAVWPAGEGNSEQAVGFHAEWVCDGQAEARRYLAGHSEPEGTSLVATRGPEVIGLAAILCELDYGGFRYRGIPLVHQVAVAGAVPAARRCDAAHGRGRAAGPRPGNRNACGSPGPGGRGSGTAPALIPPSGVTRPGAIGSSCTRAAPWVSRRP